MKRKKIRLRYKKERVLFSDVLPYELPLIFSNRYFYRFLVNNGIRIEIGSSGQDTLRWNMTEEKGILGILSILFKRKLSEFEGKDSLLLDKFGLKRIPFTYSIRHKPVKHRYLSLMHPANQIKVVDFYDKYKDIIIYLCSKSNFSIRRPNKVACYFYHKDRLHHELLGKKTDRVEMFFSEYENLKTFFSYKQYTNIYKFYEDYRYQRAEKKFSCLLKLDVQNCFDSIYTHSITWAISGGALTYKDSFTGSFDESVGAIWDKMMQEMNYNETNGIIIGPECSRIFAEVILQYIDQRVESNLLQMGFKNKADYECYRYVDDYFFFYNDEKIKNIAEDLFQKYLKEFKLSFSQEKQNVYERPFITDITKAKAAIDDLLDNAIKIYSTEQDKELIQEENNEEEQDISPESEEEPIIKISRQDAKDRLNTNATFKFNATEFNMKFKVIISANHVNYKDVLNYTIARFCIKIERVLKKVDKLYKSLCIIQESHELSDLHEETAIKREHLARNLTKFIVEILDSVFFLYANNKRVNTTLKVMQILNVIRVYLDSDYHFEHNNPPIVIKRFDENIRGVVFKKIRDEISMILQTTPIDANVQLETLFFLVILRSMNRKYHLSKDEISKYLKIDDPNNISCYKDIKFNMLAITILVYYFGNEKQFQELKNNLISWTLQRIEAIPENRRKISAEYVIFALDMAACPYVKPSIRTKILQKVGVSKREGDFIVKYMKHQRYMFTKWTGVDVTKELNAKISQEVYS